MLSAEAAAEALHLAEQKMFSINSKREERESFQLLWNSTNPT